MSGTTLSQREAEAPREFSVWVRAALGSNLREVRLFGSKARGVSRPDSDLDALVIVTDDHVRAEDLAIDRGAMNRYYYGGFHAARALLATRHVASARHAVVHTAPPRMTTTMAARATHCQEEDFGRSRHLTPAAHRLA